MPQLMFLLTFLLCAPAFAAELNAKSDPDAISDLRIATESGQTDAIPPG